MPNDDSESSELLRIGVSFPPATGGPGPARRGVRPSTALVRELLPSRETMDRALAALTDLGFVVTGRGLATASIRGTREQYERLTTTSVARREIPVDAFTRQRTFPIDSNQPRFLPSAVAPLIDDVTVQRPHAYVPWVASRRAPSRALRAVVASTPAAAVQTPPSPTEPAINQFHLSVPDGVAQAVGADVVHQAGNEGSGVRVAMVDSGFEHSHPFFTANQYASTIVAAPGAADPLVDENGHGTGISANFFSVAPEVEFIGVKLDNPADPSTEASVLEGFQLALQHAPRVISLSVGYNVFGPNRTPGNTLPPDLVPLETEIAAAIAAGIVVVAAAGNGQFYFPAQMPSVIAVGGVFVDAKNRKRASNMASAYTSVIYPGRAVPDLCGLVGMRESNKGAYIALPVPAESTVDRRGSFENDGTATDDGWAVFSGTSSATPQVAGVCALLLAQDPSLTPQEVKDRLMATAIPVTVGRASRDTDPAGKGLPANQPNGATGAGLVNACAACGHC